MAVVTFDTLKFANTLKAAGVPEKQAEAQASAFAEVMHVNLKDLVTKDDLDRGLGDLKTEVLRAVLDLRSELSVQIDSSEKKLNAKIDNMDTKFHGENVLLRWMVGVVLLGTLMLLARSFFLRGPII